MSVLRNERGVILMFALGMMVALLLIGAASSLFTRGGQRLSVNVRDATRALYAAEAGLGWAHAQLRGADATLYFDSSAALDGSPVTFGQGTRESDVGVRDADGRRTVTATGVVAGVSRKLRARFRRSNLDPGGPNDCLGPGDADSDGICDGRPGLVSVLDLTLPGGSLVDSYHGDGGPYAAGSGAARGAIATNGVLQLAGSGTTLRGDVFVGRFEPGGNALEGTRTPSPALLLPPLPSHSGVCSGHTNPSLVDCNPPYGTITAVLAGAPPEQTLTVGSGQTICMPAGIYCFQRIFVQQGGKLRIVDTPASGISSLRTTLQLGTPAGGLAALEVRGRLEFGTGMKPNLLRVFARADVEISGWAGAVIPGLFYAPAGTIRLNTNSAGNAADLMGLAWAAQLVFGTGPVRFHVDEDGRFGDFCASPTDPTCRPALVVREDWVEIRG